MKFYKNTIINKEKILIKAIVLIIVPTLFFVILFFLDLLNNFLNIISKNNFLLVIITFFAILTIILLLYSILCFINEIKQLEIIKDYKKKINRSKTNIYYLLNSTLTLVYIADINNRVNWANQSLLSIDKNIVGKQLTEIFNYNNNETQQSLINKVISSQKVEKNTVYYPQNTLLQVERYLEHNAIPIVIDEEISFVVITEDITEQIQLVESKQRLSLMVSASEDAIFVLDLNRNITSWNKGAEAIFGYSIDEIIGQPITILDHLINFNVLTSIFDLDKIIKTKIIYNVENVDVNRLDAQLIVDFTVYPFFDDSGAVVGISAIVRDRTETIKAKKALELSEMQMRKLALHLDAIREQERKDIAFVIHDELGYALSAIKMDISWLRRNIEKMSSESIMERTNDMLKLVDVTIQNVKTLSSNLRPSILDHFGLIAAIEEQSREFQRRTGIRCRVNVTPTEDISIPEVIRTPIFRIFQEAQTNITRYAKASRVDVNISYEKELFMLEIIDNGVGIPEEKINSISSFGLLGIKEKANSIGGKIFISGKKDEGTIIRLELIIKLE